MLTHECSFDCTEFNGDLTPSNVTHLPPILSGTRVLFRAVLSVHLLAHLSNKGQEYITSDLRDRVTKSALNGVQLARHYTHLDVDTLFSWNQNQAKSERYNICILIQGYMHLTASFMRCKFQGPLIWCDTFTKTFAI